MIRLSTHEAGMGLGTGTCPFLMLPVYLLYSPMPNIFTYTEPMAEPERDHIKDEPCNE